MRMSVTLVAGAVALSLYAPRPAQAYECPKHIVDARTAINTVLEDMKGEMSKTMANAGMKFEMTLVHSLLDDAKMRLASAKHNHEKPQGAYDHARAIAKADAAKGYATAADIFHFKLMAKMPKMKMKK